jgi:hypothetical protein
MGWFSCEMLDIPPGTVCTTGGTVGRTFKYLIANFRLSPRPPQKYTGTPNRTIPNPCAAPPGLAAIVLITNAAAASKKRWSPRISRDAIRPRQVRLAAPENKHAGCRQTGPVFRALL